MLIAVNTSIVIVQYNNVYNVPVQYTHMNDSLTFFQMHVTGWYVDLTPAESLLLLFCVRVTVLPLFWEHADVLL